MADDAEVKLGADVSGLKSDTADGASSVDASLKKIQSSLDDLRSKSKQVSDDIKSHNASIAEAFANLNNTVSSHFAGLVAGIGRVRSAIIGISSILSGGILGKEAVEAFTGMADTVRGLQITMGMGSEAATKLAVNLKLAGIEASTFEQMVFRVGMRLRTSAEDFDKLGVSVRNTSTGELLPTETILQNIYKRMLDFKPGADQMEFALTTVGRNARDFARDMELLNATNQRAGQLMEQLGIEMGGARQGQVRAYQVEFRAFKVVLDEVGVTLGSAMLPHLEKLAAWLVSVGPAAIRNVSIAFGILGDAIDIVVTIIKTLYANYLALAEAIAFAVGKVVQWGTAIINAIPGMHSFGTELLKLLDYYERFNNLTSPLAWAASLLGITKNNKAGANQIVNDTTDMFRRLKLLTADYSQYENDAWSKIEKARAGASMGIPSSGKNLGMPDMSKGGPTQVELWKQQLEQLRMAEGLFQEFSKEQEAAFWEAKLALVKKGTKDYNEIYSLLYQARKGAAQQELQDDLAKWAAMITAAQNNKEEQIGIAVARTATMKAIYGEDRDHYQVFLNEELKLREEWRKKEEAIMKERTKMVEDAAVAEVALEQEYLNQQVALREVSTQQKFAKEQELENKLYALRLKALQEELATLDSRTLAYLQVEHKIEALEQAHQLKLTTIADQAELDRKAVALQAAQDVENAFGTFIDDLISRNKTLKQSFQDLVKSITSDLNKLASQEIAKSLFGPGTGGNNLLAGLFGKIFGGGAGDTTLQATHTAALSADTTATATLTTSLLAANTALAAFTASLAASGAGAGITAIGGSIFGEGGAGVGFGFSDALASFDVGTPYVPQDTLAIVHKGEAIIPAAMNRGGAVSTGPMHMHFYISGNPDSRTLDQIQAAAARGASKSSRSVM